MSVESKERLVEAVLAEVARQREKYGGFGPTAADVRLAVAVLEDEVREALEEWRGERPGPGRSRPAGFERTQAEILQVAAVAFRVLEDLGFVDVRE